MRTTLACVAAGAGVLLAVAPVGTHHAFSAEFDINKPLSLKGTLVKWEMINPHSWFHIDVEDEDGTVVTWMIEGGSPNELIRLGVTKNTLAIGTELTIEGYQSKDGTAKAVGRNFTLANGDRLFLGGSANRIGGVEGAQDRGQGIDVDRASRTGPRLAGRYASLRGPGRTTCS